MADIIPYKEEDYLKEMRDRTTFAFEQSVVFDKYLQLFNTGVDDIQTVLKQLMQERSIDTAVGKQLDIIGDIVGQPRELVDSDFIPYFGFDGAFEAQSYGDLNDPKLGGYYWDYTQSLTGSVLLNDEQYRIFIKAKILKNTTRATPEDVIYFISYVFGAKKVQITVDYGAEQALVLVSDDLNQFEIALLKYFVEKPFKSYFVPKSLGVGYVFGTTPTYDFFSYLGVPEGKGYGALVFDEPVDGLVLDLDFVDNKYQIWEKSLTIVGGGKYAFIF